MIKHSNQAGHILQLDLDLTLLIDLKFDCIPVYFGCRAQMFRASIIVLFVEQSDPTYIFRLQPPQVRENYRIDCLAELMIRLLSTLQTSSSLI